MAGRWGRILITDDEVAVRRLMHEILSREGYQCGEAGNADELMEKMRLSPADLVILDIKMPGKTGVEVLPEIKAGYPDTAVMMATAVTDTDTAVECMKQGAYDYLTKPFNLTEVILSVERALEKKQLELENRDYQQHLEQKVGEQADKIRGSFLRAIAALVYALEAKDKYSSGHSQRVSKIAVALARELNIAPESIEKIRLAGLVHDIGKIGVKESVLNKPGTLTHEEYQHIMAHCEIGERILTPIVEDKEILDMVRHHHEHYDGSGYPDGLSGEQILPGANILAVAEAYLTKTGAQAGGGVFSEDTSILALADAYDAMTSNRPYRSALTPEAAVEEIKRGAGTQFAPRVIEAFLRLSLADIITEDVDGSNI
jgi:putative two-component system response regulator